jgi:NH3-dependent NAD+ synthetase
MNQMNTAKITSIDDALIPKVSVSSEKECSQETIPKSVSSSEQSLESERESIKLSQDVIILELLKNRPQMSDVNEKFEKERQRRMYNMLRHSNHYKRLQVIFNVTR